MKIDLQRGKLSLYKEDGEKIEADAVILTIPYEQAMSLLGKEAKSLAQPLTQFFIKPKNIFKGSWDLIDEEKICVMRLSSSDQPSYMVHAQGLWEADDLMNFLHLSYDLNLKNCDVFSRHFWRFGRYLKTEPIFFDDSLPIVALGDWCYGSDLLSLLGKIRNDLDKIRSYLLI
jgi:predicted NAD/FAD-dependent oxidoreductase